MSDFDPTAWQQADINTTEERTGPPEPGTYVVALEDAKAFTSKAGNSVMVLDLRVTGGDADGYAWGEVRGFANDGQIKAAKATCSRIGVDVDHVTSLDEIDELLKQHVGEFYEVNVVQNGDYRNVYVNGHASGDFQAPQTDVPADTSDFEPAASPAGGVPDEDIPF